MVLLLSPHLWRSSDKAGHLCPACGEAVQPPGVQMANWWSGLAQQTPGSVSLSPWIQLLRLPSRESASAELSLRFCSVPRVDQLLSNCRKRLSKIRYFYQRSSSGTSTCIEARSPHASQSGPRTSQNASSSWTCFRVCPGVTDATYVLMSGLHPWSIEAVLALAMVIFLPLLQAYLLLSFPIIKAMAILFNSRHTNPSSSGRTTALFNFSSN